MGVTELRRDFERKAVVPAMAPFVDLAYPPDRLGLEADPGSPVDD
jgi:hypothetical protein